MKRVSENFERCVDWISFRPECWELAKPIAVDRGEVAKNYPRHAEYDRGAKQSDAVLIGALGEIVIPEYFTARGIKFKMTKLVAASPQRGYDILVQEPFKESFNVKSSWDAASDYLVNTESHYKSTVDFYLFMKLRGPKGTTEATIWILPHVVVDDWEPNKRTPTPTLHRPCSEVEWMFHRFQYANRSV